MSTKKILMRWETYSYNDAGIYVVNGIMHDVKELYEKAMTRKDSEGGLWFSTSYPITPNNLTMSELVSMAEDHYTNMDMSPGDWEKMGYKRAKGYKAAALDKKELRGEADPQVKQESQDTQTKKEPQQIADPQDKQVKVPLWMVHKYDIIGKSISGLDMFIQASVIVDSNGTSWHFTDVEFATLDPSLKYLTSYQTRKVALRNIPLNDKSPEELSKAIRAWYPHR